MAEARREEEKEGERRDLRDRSQTADRPERTKAEHLHSCQGPLSSIRAAIKRTRSSPQSDSTRDRRRPEITIVSAEPLVSNNWFSGSTVVFPPPQPGWSADVEAVSKPPPSYDQVIKEKTQEENTVKPTAAPRRKTCTASSGTQTDPVREHAAAQRNSAGKKPQKPPRPSLPKPAERKLTPEADGEFDATTSTNGDGQSDSNLDVKQLEKADQSTHTCTRSVTVHWDILTTPCPVSAVSTDPTPSPRRPVPRPRSKSRKQAAEEETKVQILVKLSENCEDIQSDPQEEVSSNKYLQELLEVFGADNELEDNSDVINQSDEDLQDDADADEMSDSHSQRNIRARIQAFETQVPTEEGNAFDPARTAPPTRKPSIKPPVAAKPSVALKPQLSYSTDDYQNISSANTPQAPKPAPRPQSFKKPAGLSIKEELETLHSKGGALQRSRPSVLTRANTVYEDEVSPVPPLPPAKPHKEPLKPNLNINNHNSASMVRDIQYADTPSFPVPVKPQVSVDSNGASFNRQSVTKRPTTIRVPSKTDLVADSFQDRPPPLPIQKPVGALNTSLNQKQTLTHAVSLQESFSASPLPSLPPRKPSVNRSLPPRPPPAKPGPGRPPPPSLQAIGRSQTVPTTNSPRPKPQRKGLVLPPRPNPGHRLYNKYTLQLPHGIAAFDYNGSNAGELSFQKNEVLLLLKEINHNEFECQAGETKGRVHKSRMQIITPLDSYDSPPEGAGTPAWGGDDGGLKVKAMHDFFPEQPGELSLRAGDVVTMVEQVNNEWYRGTCKGSTGFFPVNYVKVLPNSPKPLPERIVKPPPASVSGPRCVARFDFDGEHSDELTFCEGDVIKLTEYVGQEWARGEVGGHVGIFPLNFVEIVEDLPPPPSQPQSARVALPGMAAASHSMTPEAANPAQASQSNTEWVVALYDYAGQSEDDLSFQQGDTILITQHIDQDWSRGRLNGREGFLPRAFVEASGQQFNNQQNGAANSLRAEALYNFTSDCDEELSLKIGDIITNLESMDDEWFLGDLRERRGLVPKNYVKVLG
ncbi:SH3 domain-containing protein 19 isoform X2 [Mugil cephalus]|uniref:SH3 domain-containing protein 19 isoform X2 n=1 Tax=Mugil cephalus TaxID=48193 RepID=UPI001FB5F78B|nr:SH3 domain-containing protein 19 isoform X2 [Mugil cephalus]